MGKQTKFVMNALGKSIDSVVKKITLDVTANLIGTTPVDTGWARANWIPTIGAPVIEDLSGVDTKGDKISRVSEASAKQGAGNTSVLKYTLKSGDTFVTNNVPYIRDLNDGSSEQAPSGFVQLAIQKALTQDIKRV